MKDISMIRALRGFTQQEVADHLGVTKQRYCQIEKANKPCGEETMRKLADLFGVSVFELLGEDSLRVKPKNAEELASAISALSKGL